jgi:NAD(P)H-flavin reductase
MSHPLVTLPVCDVLPATIRSRIVRIGAPGTKFVFRAGQAVSVGAHGQDARKPYSIACAPEDTAEHGWIELLMQVGDTGAPGVHLERLEPGTLVDVEGPSGRFVFPKKPKERHFLFVAGGTGISPLRAMIRHALRSISFDTEPAISLLYSARTSQEFAYASEFQELAARGRIRLTLTVTRDSEGPWSGLRGRIGLAQLHEMVPDGDTLCFICGPPPLVGEIAPMLRTFGVPEGRIRIDER